MLKKIGINSVFLIAGLGLGYIFFMPESNGTENLSETSSQDMGRWTCSMHPEVDGKENGTCPLCKMDLVYMDAVMSNGLPESQFKMSKEALALANIETSKVSLSTAESGTISISGIITTNKDTDAVQTTLFDGRVDAFYMSSIGKRVRKNQEIGTIYSPDLYLAQDKLLSSVSYKEKNMKLYLAARNTLGLWKMTDAQIEELIRSKTPQQNFPLYADVSGTVTEVVASEGNYYKQGDVLFKTSDLRTVWAAFDVYESQLNSFKVGQDILIETSIIGAPIKAKISFIEPVLNESTRTGTVRAVIPNKGNRLKPGMVITGKVSPSTPDKPIISIPKSAVLWTGKRSLVYKQVAEHQPIFEAIEVVLGQGLADTYEVLQGLSIGDMIVSQGTFTVDAAAQLNGSRSMMSNAIDDAGSGKKRMLLPGETQNSKMPLELNGLPENSLQEQVNSYMLLKDAFVGSDKRKIKQQAKALLAVLPDYKIQINDKVALGTIDEITNQLQGIQTAGNLKDQRTAFKSLSNNMLKLLTETKGNGATTIYVQHCDCADNNTGASWLSYAEEIRNPFFGDAMLNCGRVERVLQ